MERKGSKRIGEDDDGGLGSTSVYVWGRMRARSGGLEGRRKKMVEETGKSGRGGLTCRSVLAGALGGLWGGPFARVLAEGTLKGTGTRYLQYCSNTCSPCSLVVLQQVLAPVLLAQSGFFQARRDETDACWPVGLPILEFWLGWLAGLGEPLFFALANAYWPTDWDRNCGGCTSREKEGGGPCKWRAAGPRRTGETSLTGQGRASRA